MSSQEVIDKVIELKVIGIKEQQFEICSHLRDIENSFTKSKHTKVHIEPTEENLKIELTKMFEYFKRFNTKSSVIRDIKIMFLLDEL